MTVGNQIIDGVGGYNAATFGSPNPEFRTNLMVDCLRGSHRARVTWRHLSKLHLTPAEAKDDPLRHGAQTTSTGGIYEVRGRVFRLGLNWAF